MTLRVSIMLTPVTTSRGPGHDWRVVVGSRDIEGYTNGSRKEAWRDVVDVATVMLEQEQEPEVRL